jgi:hypothetical protein
LGAQNAGLLFGADPGEDRRTVHDVAQLRVVKRVEVGTGEGATGGNVEGPTHGLGDQRVVSGDDLDGDSELSESGDRPRGGRLGLVDKDEESDKVQVVLVSSGDAGQLGSDPAGDGHDTVARAELGCEHSAGVVGDFDASDENGLRGAFGDEEPFVVPVGEHRHATTIVIERGDGGPVERSCRTGGSTRGFPQGDVERVATHRGVAGAHGLVAHETEREDVGVVVTLRVDRAREGDVTISQSAGLVGEQHVDVTKVLDTHESLDQHLLLGEPPRTSRQAGRYHGGEELRSDADRDREGEQDGIDDGAADDDVDHEDRDAEQATDLGQQPRKAGEADLKLRLRMTFPEPGGDPSELSSRPRRDHDGIGSAFVHDGSHKQTRRQLRERRAARHWLGRLVCGGRLTSQDGLVALQVARAEEADIGRHDRADAQVHDVAGHQVSDLDAYRRAVAGGSNILANLRVHCLGCLLGPILVHEPESDRGCDDHSDDQRIESLTHDPRHRSCCEQQPQQRVAELA